jgi:hypothetical protein
LADDHRPELAAALPSTKTLATLLAIEAANSAFITCGWVDDDKDYRLTVHDWHQHADDATKLSIKRSKRNFVAVLRQCVDGGEEVRTRTRLPKPESEPEPDNLASTRQKGVQ